MAVDSSKRYGVVGLGRTGISVVQFLLAQQAEVVAFDTRNAPALAEQLPATVPLHTGPLDAAQLAQCDVLVVSPGLSVQGEPFSGLRQAGKAVIGDIELFAQVADAPVVAITGSNGKTTVTTLVGEMAKEAGIAVGVGGNIGTPALELLGKGAALYVLELSSFQLETTETLSLCAATVLNVSADHMNRYADLAAYRDAKRRIYRHSRLCVVNADDPATQPVQSEHQVEFSLNGEADYWIGGLEPSLMAGDKALMTCRDLKMSGRHNWANALAAIALGDAAGIPRDAMVRVLKQFPGLSHRCELVGIHHGVRWINDSKATNIGATAAALQGFADEPGNTWLIAGGDGKGADFNELAPWLKQVAGGVVFGRDGEQIAAVWPEAETVTDLAEAVRWCQQHAVAGDRVLLSPACASWDMYNGFAQRGDHFRELVEAL